MIRLRFATTALGVSMVIVLSVWLHQSSQGSDDEVSSAQVAVKPLKIFIAVDSEGPSGISEYWGRNNQPESSFYLEKRRLMTLDANAAVEGCLKAGATEVIVSDDGIGGVNMIPELFHSEAKWIQGHGFGSQWKLPFLHGLDESFDAVVLVGFHAMQGTPDGLLAHTFSSRTDRRYWLNGRESGELAMYAAVAGHFGVPIIAVTGDAAFCREAKDQLSDSVVTVEVKKGFNEERALLIAPKKAREMISEGVKRAVGQVATGRFHPLHLDLPIQARLQFPTRQLADAHEKKRRQQYNNWNGRRVNETSFTATFESPLELSSF